jgi:hypothetical protein
MSSENNISNSSVKRDCTKYVTWFHIVLLLPVFLSGCTAVYIAGSAVSVGASAVSVGASAVGVAVDVAGAGVHAVVGGSSEGK